jgi:group II intron reverse transcriptase/maturase
MKIGPADNRPSNSERVQKLQAALRTKAKENSAFRFYSLYDKVCLWYVMHEAYEHCRKNAGAPGVDGQTFADIEAYGRERWLEELAEELRKKTYEPQALRRTYIPKANGKLRALSIPTIRDRVVQTAVLLIIGPIFEVDLPAELHGYREGHSAHQAIAEVQQLLYAGHRQVVDADLSDYFGSIPHAELMKCLARRISDKALLHLLKQWLVMAVEETDARGRVQRTTPYKKTGRGMSQGSPISPLFGNLYLRRFVLGWQQRGHADQFAARIVNYADDLVILCRRGADRALAAMRDLMRGLKLTVNEEKTKVCCVPTESFDFLSYTFGRLYSPRKGGQAYLGCRPSRNAVRAHQWKISLLTGRRTYGQSAEELVKRLNQALRGWANYFNQGTYRPAWWSVDAHLRHRLYQWHRRKHSGSSSGWQNFSQHLDTLGLCRLTHSAPAPRGRRSAPQ